MDQREFNRQMGNYLRDRKSERKSWLSRLTSGVPRVEIVSEDEEQPPQEVPKEHVDAVLRGETVPRPEHEEAIEDALAEQESGIRSWWRRIFSGSSETMEMDDIETAPVEHKPAVDQDVKEMLRICVQWVNRLPAEDIQEIRRSDNYQEFKRLLDKYGLLKK